MTILLRVHWFTTKPLTAAMREPWQTSRDGIGAEVESKVVAGCACSVRPMVDVTTDD